MAGVPERKEPWGYGWRSCKLFVMVTTAITLLSDVFLHEFMVSILPYLLENRLGLVGPAAQNVSLALMAQSALVSFILTPALDNMNHSSYTKELLLFGLLTELLGSVVIASARSLLTLFTGRMIQSLANTVVGVTGFTNLNQNTSTNERGQIYGIITTAIAAGSCSGPMIAGVLLEKAGYRIAWSCAIIGSSIGILFQAIMVQPNVKSESTKQLVAAPQGLEVDKSADEETPLLSSSSTAESNQDCDVELVSLDGEILQTYYLLLTHKRFLGGMVCGFFYAVISSSFGTTVPLHVQDTFHWGSLPTGILFAAIQGPNMVLCVPIHWLKESIGMKHLTVTSFALLAPLLWLVGVPGEQRFSWADPTEAGPFIFGAAFVGIGIISPLLNGIGMVEARNATDEIEATSQQPKEDSELLYTRAVQLSRLIWSSGLFFGPILSGILTERYGYYKMNFTLAGICIICAFFAIWSLGSSVPQRPISRSPRTCGA